MDKKLSNLADILERCSIRAKEKFSSLSEEQLNWKPSPDKWSAAECIDHLVVSNRQYLPALEQITGGKYKNTFWQNISPLSGFFGKMLIKGVMPETEKKMKTARVFMPSSSSYSKKIIDELSNINSKLIAYMEKLSPGDLNHVISSPVTKFITYSVEDALKILAYHEIRHLDQAENVTKIAGFPKK